MSRSLILGAGIVSAALALCVPLVAQDRPDTNRERGDRTSEGVKGTSGHEEITIDRPFAEVVGKTPLAIERAGLILVADVDWSRFKGRTGMGTMPGNRLDVGGTVSNIRSFFLTDNESVNKIFSEKPEKALWAPAIAVCEKGGKTCLLYYKPLAKLEEMKAKGVIPPEKYEEHLEHARQWDKKLNQVIENLRGVRSD